jgi:pimeloyl-ACP methyl ester carboxylesterase
MKKRTAKEVIAGAPPATRRARFRAWHASLPLWQRAVLWFGVALALTAFIQLSVNAYLFYNSLVSDDLALFLTLENETVTLAPGASTVITATLGVKNLPLCSAHCTWNATDLATGTVLAQGSGTYRNAERDTLEVSMHAAARGEEDKLVRVEVMCANKRNTFCKSSGDERAAVETARVRTRYNDTTRASRDRVEEQIASWVTSAAAIEQTLESILTSANDSTRLLEYREAASQDKELLATLVNRVQTAIERDDYVVAESTLQEPLPMTTVRALARDSERELAVREHVLVLQSRMNETRALELLAPPADVALVRTASTNLASAIDAFTSEPLANAERAAATLTTLLNDLNTRSAPWVAASNNRTSLVADEWRVACALTGYGCERVFLPANTLVQAAALEAQTCEEIGTLRDDLDDVRVRVAIQIASREGLANNSLEAVEDALNVSELRNDSAFQARIPLIRAQALMNASTALNLTPAEQLAYPFTDVDDVINAQRCPLPNATIAPLVVPQPFLANLPPSNATLPPITLPGQRCCGSGVCVSCPAPARTAIVFVHGFSFAEGTTPESNINAMVPLALYFDEKNVATYIGHVFPQQSAQSSTPITAGLPGSYSVTTTYYYDSYAEEGSVRFVTQKSENIETYAIRLREAVAIAQARTGSERVVIVAHSMGGLVARRYLQLFGEEDVAALIMLGTPNAGVTGRTQQFCDVFGSPIECEDMYAGSLFLNKVNAAPPPSIPVYTFSGVGCDERAWDGVVEAESVALPFANNMNITGVCEGTSELLHNTFINPAKYPALAQAIEEIVTVSVQ